MADDSAYEDLGGFRGTDVGPTFTDVDASQTTADGTVLCRHCSQPLEQVPAPGTRVGSPERPLVWRHAGSKYRMCMPIIRKTEAEP